MIDHDLLTDVIKLRLQGLTKDQIGDRLSDKNLSEYQLIKLHNEAGKKIRYIQENEVLNTRVLHAKRYENLYGWFIENDFDDYAMKMLENIERLMGLHSNTIGLSIHNIIEGKPQKVNLYKEENLSSDEFKRLKILLDKAKIDR